jgi:hypothetical protein
MLDVTVGSVNKTAGLYVKVMVDDADNVAPDTLSPVVLITTVAVLDVTLLVVGVPEIVTGVPNGTVVVVNE